MKAQVRDNVATWLSKAGSGYGREPVLGEAATYQTLWRLAHEHAKKIAATTPKGARVLIELSPTTDRIATLLGILAAGRVAVPVGRDMGAARLDEIATLVEAHSCVGEFAWVHGGFDVRPVGSNTESGVVRSHGEADYDDAAMVVFTSGTTGPARGVVLSHSNIMANAGAVLSVLPMVPSDRVSLLLPLCHAYGLSILFTTLMARAQLIPHDLGLFAGDIVMTANAHRATILPGVPYQFMALARGASGKTSDALPV